MAPKAVTVGIPRRSGARALRVVAAALALTMLAHLAYAGYSEGLAAFNKQDYAGALAHWRPLAESGDPAAQFSLGWMYLKGRGVAQDDTQAFQLIHRSAQKGLARAQSELGWMYAHSRGVDLDPKLAASWYAKAAEAGDRDAQAALGRDYLSGYGVPHDEVQGANWLLKAARQGDLESQILTALAFENGTGVAKSEDKASYWYLAAAMQGDSDSQRAIAVRYAEGRGIERDPVLSYAWFRIFNRDHAAQEQSFLERHLPGISAMDLERGRSLAQAWQVHEDIRRK